MDPLRAVRVAGAAVVALFVLLVAVMPSAPARALPPGFVSPVVAFELATEPAQVLDLLGHPGDEARAATVAAMDRGNRIDFLFLLAYPALYAAIGALLVRRGAPAGLGWAVAGLAVAMSVGDAVENVQLLTLSGRTEPEAMASPLAWLHLATGVKWTAVYGASALVAPFVWRDPSRWRWSALLFGLGAAIGAAGVVWPPAIEFGSYPLGLAWLWSSAHAWAVRIPAPGVRHDRSVR